MLARCGRQSHRPLRPAHHAAAAAELDDHGGATYRFYLQGTTAPTLDHVPAAVAAPAAVHAGTLGLVLEPLATAVERSLAQLPSSTLVFLDPNCRPRVVADRDAYQARLERLYLRADVVELSTEDIEYLTPGSDPLAYATALLGAGPTVVLVTDGGAGAWAVTAHDETMVPVRPVEVADTMGARDGFGGAFLGLVAGPRVRAHRAARPRRGRGSSGHSTGGRRGHVQPGAGAEPPRRTELSARWQRAGGWRPGRGAGGPRGRVQGSWRPVAGHHRRPGSGKSTVAEGLVAATAGACLPPDGRLPLCG